MRRFALLALACVAAGEPPPHSTSPWAGINLAGAEFNHGALPGRPGTDYVFPDAAQLDWVEARGFQLVRLPVLWERLQPALGGPLDPGELARLKAVASLAGARRLRLVIDVHNYGDWRGGRIGTEAVPVAAFADLWRRVAVAFSGDPGVMFGLMNEPKLASATEWSKAQQAAVDAIRAGGARNTVIASGVNWDGVHSFTHRFGGRTSNAEALAELRDPAGALLFEAHQYLDADFSGTHADCPRAAEVEALLGPMTRWLRDGGRRGFLGEFGGGPGPDCVEGLRRLVGFMDANRDVWAGWAAWSAGAWWRSDYPLLLSPGRDGAEKPQMRALRP